MREVAVIKRHEDFDILANMESLRVYVWYDVVLMQSAYSRDIFGHRCFWISCHVHTEEFFLVISGFSFFEKVFHWFGNMVRLVPLPIDFGLAMTHQLAENCVRNLACY